MVANEDQKLKAGFVEGLISVILPVWKPNINELKTCLDSLIAQTYPNIEINIVYKKSSEFDDAFYLLINGCQDKRIKVINYENKGFASIINEGIRNSRGEFIARIDADDWCSIDRFEKQLKFKKKHKCNIVGSWGHVISKNGKKIGISKLQISHEEIRKKIMFRCPLIDSSALMDRSMLEEIGLYDISFVESLDDEIWFRAMYKGYKFGNVPECLVTIRYDPQSRSHGDDWRKARIYAIKAKTKAVLHYGFFKPLDLFYYLQVPLYYFISPKNAMKVRRLRDKITSTLNRL